MNCANNNKCVKSTIPFDDKIDDTVELQNKITKANNEYRLAVLSDEANKEIQNNIPKPIHQYTFLDYYNGNPLAPSPSLQSPSPFFKIINFFYFII